MRRRCGSRSISSPSGVDPRQAPIPTLPRRRRRERGGTRNTLPRLRGREAAVWRRAADALLGLVALTILAGGFVAGLHAARTYNPFPLMDGSFVPAGYAQLQPFICNWFENV